MIMIIPVRDTPHGAIFRVRVAPRASRTAVTGVLGDGHDAAVKIALNAPPVEGRANAALVEFLSGLLGTARSAIEISAGQRGRTKTILVRGCTAARIAVILERSLANPDR